MGNNITSGILVALLGIGICSCSGDIVEPEDTSGKMRMEFAFSHPESATRATDTAFENGDNVGLFVHRESQPLEIAGNVVNNECLTYDGKNWKASRQLYWDKGDYGVAAYYPYMEEISSVTDLPFEVATDQSGAASGNSLSPYEASDFLYSTKRLAASSTAVNMTFRHIMSKISVRLIKGEEYEGDLPEVAEVYIHNTVPSATIDLTAGVATKAPKGASKTIKARKAATNTYSAIVVPQRLENRVPLLEVVMNGVSFLYESKFLFKPGVHHLVNLVIDKNPEQIKIEIGGEIVNWN